MSRQHEIKVINYRRRLLQRAITFFYVELIIVGVISHEI